jgi:8-oxo-dGTP pyrophosphatase MutT (NUDIX family)
MFQQNIHKSRLTLASCRSVDILAGFTSYVRSLGDRFRIPVRIDEVIFETQGSPPFDRGLKLVVTDEAGREIGRYLVLAVEWVEAKLTSEIVKRVRERAEMGFGDAEDPAAVIVLHGVHTADRFELQGALSLHDRGHTPIHIVRFALGANEMPVKRVAHAIIPVRRTAGGPADEFLITLSPGNTRPRLPGGKIENEETPTQAVVREIGEELGLSPHDLEIADCIVPEGINILEVSPSSGLLTYYRIFPFVVRVLESGIPGLLRRIYQPSPDDDCKVWPHSFQNWISDGLGFDTSYPKAVWPKITSEQLNHAALDLI